jgi:hypothetical protein
MAAGENVSKSGGIALMASHTARSPPLWRKKWAKTLEYAGKCRQRNFFEVFLPWLALQS